MIQRPTIEIDFDKATEEDWQTVYETQRHVEGGGKLEPGLVLLGKRVTLTAPPVQMWRAVTGRMDAED